MSCPDAPIARPLEAIRAELDEIDQQIHELVVRRATLAEEVRGAKTDTGAAALRPAREAQMLHRLAGFDRGPMRLDQIWRLWRELIMANARLQFPFTVDTVAASRDLDLWDAGRAHFCHETEMVAHDSAAAALASAAAGPSRVALLPAGDPSWWGAMRTGAGGMRVFAALPMVADGPAAPLAMVAADIALDPCGRDVTVVHVARAGAGEDELRKLFAAAGHEVVYAIAAGGGALVGIAGFMTGAEGARAPFDAGIEGLDAAVIGAHAAPAPGSAP